MKKTFIILLLYGLYFSSCIPYRTILRERTHEPVPFSAEKLNGAYQNNSGLWFTLFKVRDDSSKKLNYIPDSTHVEIELLSKKRAKVLLKKEQKLIDSILLKGRIKGQYFSVRRKLSGFPFFPILYSRNEYKILLANNAKGNLLILKGEVSEGLVLGVIGGVHKKNNSKEYTKI